MKSIKEKQLLVNLAKSFGQDVDPVVLREVQEHNKIENNIRESIRSNIFEDLSKALTELKQEADRVSIENDFPLPPSLDDLDSILAEEENVLVQTQHEETPTETPANTLTELAAEAITASAKRDSFQQPDPLLVAPDVNSIQKKIRFLEQWIAKVSMAGPGSGETRFLRLDDVNKNSFAARDTHKILRYRPNNISAYDEVFFGNLSGDQGPIYSMQYDTSGYTSNANVVAGLTAWNNVDDCLDIYQADGSICQVGQENYIRVYNPTANTYDNGTFIEFIGVDPIDQTPTFRPFVNDANTRPLFGIGVLTTDVAANSHGRATTLGMVRNLDTTGASVGESWQAGDILWASPTYPGNYTKNKPTAPYVSQSVAAVTKANATSGSMLVRPTIWPRLQYLDCYTATPQSALSPLTDTKISLETILFSSGFQLSNNTIVASASGLYKFDLRVQITSSSASTKSIIVWYKKNGVNIPYSAVRQSVADNGGYATIVNSQLISLQPNNNVSVHFSVTDTSLSVDSPEVFDGAPNIPAVQLTVIEASL